MHVTRATACGLTEDRLERLERLDRLVARDACDARDRREAVEAAEARSAQLHGLCAAEAKDQEAVARALLVRLVDECGQAHLVSGWPEPLDATRPFSADERRLLAQLVRLDHTVPGGLAGYIGRARTLLEDSRLGRNPLEGYAPSIPTGLTLDFGGADFVAYEAKGARAVGEGSVGFVLVAGGMGERLGFSGIKLALPAELATGTTYLQLYASHILALSSLCPADQKPRSAPLVIMASDDTYDATRALLAEKKHFGLDPARVHLLRQQAVPCLASADGRLALAPGDRYKLLTKPNGHGEVHRLLHTSGLAAALRREGIAHLCFLQDTNALVFHALPAALGVSISRNLALNFVSVHRRAGDASGALLTLTHETDGRRVLANVEYNQLEPLLRAASGGDRGDDPDPATGFSPYPGNCNQLVVALDPYLEVLQASGGVMPEFVNPKYADASKNSFKSPTRLECMMQDLPWLLPPHAPVSFTSMDSSCSYAPAKNSLPEARAKAAAGTSPASASSADHALWSAHAAVLRLAGASVPPPATATVAGVAGLRVSPRVVLSPSFKPTIAAAVARVPGGPSVSLTPRSALVLEGDIILRALTLDGALRVLASPGAKVIIDGLRVVNEGWRLRELTPEEESGPPTPEVERLRGYALEVGQERVLRFEQPGVYTVRE